MHFFLREHCGLQCFIAYHILGLDHGGRLTIYTYVYVYIYIYMVMYMHIIF